MGQSPAPTGGAPSSTGHAIAPSPASRDAPAVRPAQVVADRFEIQRLAGTGGMGSVYLATDRRSGEPVAVKMLRGEADVEAIERFVLESRVLAQLSHPGIVRYVSHGRVAGKLFLAMEW